MIINSSGVTLERGHARPVIPAIIRRASTTAFLPITSSGNVVVSPHAHHRVSRRHRLRPRHRRGADRQLALADDRRRRRPRRVATKHQRWPTTPAPTSCPVGQGAHPDCIQLWSRPDYAADRRRDRHHRQSASLASMQGISLFNPTDRRSRCPAASTAIRHRRQHASSIPMPTGITLDECRSRASVKNNSVNSLPNYINKAQLYTSGVGRSSSAAMIVDAWSRGSRPRRAPTEKDGGG